MTTYTMQRVERKPVTLGLTTIGHYLLIALRFVVPYALPVGALCSFVVAGFLASTIIGFIVLGACLVILQVLLELRG